MAYDTNCEFSREKGGATNKGARPVPGCRSTVGCLHLATSTQPVGDAMETSAITYSFAAAAATAPLHISV